MRPAAATRARETARAKAHRSSRVARGLSGSVCAGSLCRKLATAGQRPCCPSPRSEKRRGPPANEMSEPPPRILKVCWRGRFRLESIVNTIEFVRFLCLKVSTLVFCSIFTTFLRGADFWPKPYSFEHVVHILPRNLLDSPAPTLPPLKLVLLTVLDLCLCLCLTRVSCCGHPSIH